MAWFRRKPEETAGTPKKVNIAEGLWIKCDSCKEIVYRAEVERAGRVCPKCRYPFRISARERIGLLVDSGSFEEHHGALASVDPLGFKDTKRYRDRLKTAKQKTSMEEAVVTGITHDRGQAKVSILRVPDRPGIASKVFGGLATQNIVVVAKTVLPSALSSESSNGPENPSPRA